MPQVCGLHDSRPVQGQHGDRGRQRDDVGRPFVLLEQRLLAEILPGLQSPDLVLGAV